MSAALAAPVALAGSAPALAYQGCQGGGASTITTSTTVVGPGGTITVTVTILNCDGTPASGVLVAFDTQSGPCQVSFSPAQAVTDANGVATTQATLPVGCPCQYVLRARTTNPNVTLTATVRENGCLPFTSAAATHNVAPPGPAPWTPFGMLLGLVAVLLLAAVGLAIRHRLSGDETAEPLAP